MRKYQQKFRKVKEEMSKWEELQSQLLSQFTGASAIIQRLQVFLVVMYTCVGLLLSLVMR